VLNETMMHAQATIVDALRSVELEEPGAAAAAIYDKRSSCSKGDSTRMGAS
jgi:hypothetical protein